MSNLFSAAKEIKTHVDDWREALENIQNGETDFEVSNHRFISEDEIDEIQTDELKSDTYMLGCFNAWFIADVLGISEQTITLMQKAEAFEGIGELILEMGKVEELQSAYAGADGYGHHFAHYDHADHEFTVCGNLWHIFRIN